MSESPPSKRSPKPLRTVVMLAALGFVCGGCVGAVRGILRGPNQYPFLAREYPLPHHVPQYQGGLAFRFAMAHDVVHERFERHGPAWYEERNRLAREQLATPDISDPARWPLADDFAAGLDRLGRPAESVEVMRAKLQQQEQQDVNGRDLYTSYANLGTFLIHANFRDAFSGDAVAAERFAEGITYVRQSVAVNPEAHFGRERWQLVIAEFMHAAMRSPELLQTWDFLGNRLDRPLDQMSNYQMTFDDADYGRPTRLDFYRDLRRQEYDLPELFERHIDPADSEHWDALRQLRMHITRVGAESGWDEVDVSSHRKPVPFDEPMLGIIGMWRQGGGANPHFALAIGETMLRVGQRSIAWTAFARAAQLAERYSPDPELQTFLIAHCEQRQDAIMSAYMNDQESRDFAARLPRQFEAELAFGRQFQADYQAYEERQIHSGVPLDTADFYEGFDAAHPSIASPVGAEELFRNVPSRVAMEYSDRRMLALAVFTAGCFAMIPLAWSGVVMLLRSGLAKLRGTRIA